MAGAALHTVVETGEFIRAAKAAGVSEEERARIVGLFAADPALGVALGGGLFKARIPRPDGGKSGGYRTIHFFRSPDLPVFLITIYAKNAKAALTKAEQNALSAAASRIGLTYGGSDG